MLLCFQRPALYDSGEEEEEEPSQRGRGGERDEESDVGARGGLSFALARRRRGAPGYPVPFSASRAKGLGQEARSSSALRATRTPTAAAVASGKRDVNGLCGKCDGDHDTDVCPHYPKERAAHPDAVQRSNVTAALAESPGGNQVVFFARVVRQPGDGSCLFHSLMYGLGDVVPGSASRLRRELSEWVRQHPEERIADTPVSDWVHWDSGLSVEAYARQMLSPAAWGGAIEMAAFARLKRAHVHVYECQLGGLAGYKRISVFPCPASKGKARESLRTVNLLYQGGVHYDALQMPRLGWEGRL